VSDCILITKLTPPNLVKTTQWPKRTGLAECYVGRPARLRCAMKEHPVTAKLWRWVNHER